MHQTESVVQEEAEFLQYRSFNDSDCLFNVGWRQGLVGSSPKGEIAHLSFDTALVASMTTGWEAFL